MHPAPPLLQVRDAGNLLTRAGLAMPTVDLDTYRLMYRCPTEVVRHLRAMGESNAAVARQRRLGRDTALAVRGWERGREERRRVSKRLGLGGAVGCQALGIKLCLRRAS